MLTHLQYLYGPLALIALGLLFYRPVYGLALIAAIFPMDPWAPRLPVPGLNTETILLGVALAVTVLRFGVRMPPLAFSAPVIAFTAAVFLAFVISIPWAISLRGVEGEPAIWVIFKMWKSITFTALLFFIAYWWLERAADRQLVLEALSVGLFLSATAGILDYLFAINPNAAVEGRASGFVGDPNALGESIGSMMFVPLYLVLRVQELGRMRRLFHVASYGLALAAVILSLSRGNWIAFLAAHFVFFMLVNRTALVAATAVVAVTLTLGFPFLPEVIRERIELTGEAGRVVYQTGIAVNLDSSAASRVAFARIGLDMFEASPIWGHGLHAFNFRTPEFGAKYGVLVRKDPHNIAVKLAADAGLLGLAALAWVVWGVFRCGRRLWRADTPEFWLGAVLLAMGTHELVANLSSSSFLYAKQIAAQFWIVYALSARALVERAASLPESAAQPVAAGRWRRFAQRTPAALSHP